MSYHYFCKDCGGRVYKNPLLARKPEEEAIGSLGTWRCATCKRKVKVSRRKVSEEK